MIAWTFFNYVLKYIQGIKGIRIHDQSVLDILLDVFVSTCVQHLHIM